MGRASRSFRGRFPRIPVLMYHAVGDSPLSDAHEEKYRVSATQLRDHLKRITDAGYRCSLLGELWNSVVARIEKGSSVVLTFDDGRMSDYERAYPLLLEAGVRAEFFVNTGMIGLPGYLGWTQVAEMSRAGMSFQSHGHDHVALTRLGRAALQRQLRESRRQIEDRLGSPVKFLAVPYGFINGRVKELAHQAGYRAICSSRPWPARAGSTIIGRVAVDAATGPRELLRLVELDPVCYAARALRAGLVYFPRQLRLRLAPARFSVFAAGA